MSDPSVASYPPPPFKTRRKGTATLGRDRTPGSIVLLSLITFGVYYLYWYATINREIRDHNPEIQVDLWWVVIAALFPVSCIVTAFCTAERIRQMQLDEGATQAINPVLAMLLFSFFWIGYPLYVSSHLREHWHAHERSESA